MKKLLAALCMVISVAAGTTMMTSCNKDLSVSGGDGSESTDASTPSVSEAKENTVKFAVEVEGYDGAKLEDAVVKTGESVVLPQAPEIEYYVFESWALNGNEYKAGDTVLLAEDGDVTFTAKYAKQYKVEFKVEEGMEVPEVKAGAVGDKITLPAAPNKVDFEFSGWKIGDVLYDAEAEYTPTFGLNTMEAVYNRTHYTVTFDVPEGATKVEDVKVVVGGTYTLPVEGPAFDEWHKFDCWKINGEKAEATVTVNENVTITASYINIYEVKFMNGETVLSTVKVEENQAVAAPDFTPEDGTLKEFYGVGWDKDLTSVKENLVVNFIQVYVGTQDETSFTYVPVYNNDEIVAYYVKAGTNPAARVGLPVSYNGLPVLGINPTGVNGNDVAVETDGAFVGYKAEYVYIPYDDVPEYAFYQSNVANVDFASDVTKIGNYAFYENTALASINFAENSKLDYIGAYAFAGSEDLRPTYDEIHIPASVKTVDEGAFYLSQATKLFFAENSVLETIADRAFSAERYPKTLNGSLAIQTAFPSSLVTLGEKAFYCQNVGRIDFGENSKLKTIGVSAFEQNYTGWSKVTTIIIPASVETMGKKAFYQNDAVTELVFDEGSNLTVIPEYAFKKMSLTNVVLPDSITEIGKYAFEEAIDGYPAFKLPANLQTIEYSAFKKCVLGDLVFPASITLIDDYAFNDAVFTSIQFTKSDKPLTIKKQAFASMKVAPMEITIPNNVTFIGNGAFRKVNLTAINFEKGGTTPLTIDKEAFSGYASIRYINNTSETYAFTAKNIEIPARTTSIGDYAFAGQVFMENLTFEEGSKLTVIPKGFCYNCASLKNIDIPNTVTKISSESYFVYNKADFTKVSVYTAKDKKETIPVSTDFNTQNISVVIPASVTTIEDQAFLNNAARFNSIEFKGTAQDADLSIIKNAFGINFSVPVKNKALTNVVFPANLVKVEGLFAYGTSCMYENLKNVDISACTKLTTLGEGFMKYSQVESFVVPANIETIEKDVFMGSNLKTLSFAPNSKLTTIGESAFADYVAINGSHNGTNRITVEEITIPKSVTNITKKAFSGLEKVKVMNIEEGNTVYKVVNGVVYTIDGTKIVYYPAGKLDTTYTFIDTCTTISEAVFRSNQNLQEVNFNNVTTIEGTNQFSGSKLTKVDIRNVTTLDNGTFQYCNDIVTAYVDLEKIPFNMFSQCKGLKEITLGSKITAVGGNMFSGCEALEKVTFEGTITSIGSGAFGNCKALKNLTLNSDTMVTVPNGFVFNNSNVTISVKAELLDLYNADANWKKMVDGKTVTFVAIQDPIV